MPLKFSHKLLFLLFFATLITSLWSDNIYVIFIFSIACWILLPLKKWWNNTCLLILAFSVSYSLIELLNAYSQSNFILISHIIAPIAFYQFGRFAIATISGRVQRTWFIGISVLLYLIPLFLLTAKDVVLVGAINQTRAMLSDIGATGMLSATLYGLMSSVGIGFIYMLFAEDAPKFQRIILVLISLSSVFVAIHLVNRTGLVIFAMCLFTSLLYDLRNGRYSNLLIASFISIIIIIVLLNSGDFSSNLIDAYTNREQEQEFSAAEAGGRTELWATAISNLFTYPLGWELEKYAHNIWLDIARVGGWIPFILFLCFSFTIFKHSMLLFFKSKNYFTILVTIIMLSMLLNSFVEPVIDASTLFFALLFFMSGMIQSLYSESAKTNCFSYGEF